MNYTKELMKHFNNPKFVKNLENPNGIGEIGNVHCGDIMHLEIEVKNKKIKDIGFKTFGCGAAIASSDVVCGLAKGKTLDEAKKLTKDNIIKTLCGMPPIKVHCSVLGIEALKKAIEDYEKNQKIKGKMKNKYLFLSILLSFFSFVSPYTENEEYGHHSMIDGVYGMSGIGFFGTIIWLLGIIILVLFIVWLIKQIQTK
jgi:nitrogen fixation NifU-like protein